jgi:hypothetical protein
MIDLRLCSIPLASWLDAAAAGTPVPRPDESVLGRLFVQAAEPLLPAGEKFADAELVSLAVQVYGCAAEAAGGDAAPADLIDRFVRGESPVPVPRSLADAGVIAVMPGAMAFRASEWMRSIDPKALAQQVDALLGEDAREGFQATAADIHRMLAVVAAHGCDLCCVELPA